MSVGESRCARRHLFEITEGFLQLAVPSSQVMTGEQESIPHVRIARHVPGLRVS